MLSPVVPWRAPRRPTDCPETPSAAYCEAIIPGSPGRRTSAGRWGITFTIGAPGIPPPEGHADVSGVSDSASASERDSYVTRAEGTAPGRDPRLSALLDRLSERWDVLDAPERKRLQAAIVAILELSGASEGRR